MSQWYRGRREEFNNLVVDFSYYWFLWNSAPYHNITDIDKGVRTNEFSSEAYYLGIDENEWNDYKLAKTWYDPSGTDQPQVL